MLFVCITTNYTQLSQIYTTLLVCVSHKGLWLSIQNEDHIHVYKIVTPASVSSQAVDEICGLDAFVSDLKSEVFVQNLKFNASRHVLARKQVHLSAVVVYCVHYQISHGSACRGMCVCVRRGIGGNKEKHVCLLPFWFQSLLPIFRFSVQTSDEPLIPIRLSHSLPLSRSAPCHISPLQQNKATPPPTAAAAWRLPVEISGTHALWWFGYTSSKVPRETAVPSHKNRAASAWFYVSYMLCVTSHSKWPHKHAVKKTSYWELKMRFLFNFDRLVLFQASNTLNVKDLKSITFLIGS